MKVSNQMPVSAVCCAIDPLFRQITYMLLQRGYILLIFFNVWVRLTAIARLLLEQEASSRHSLTDIGTSSVSTHDFDNQFFSNMTSLDPFDMFDSKFDLTFVDSFLEGNLDPSCDYMQVAISSDQDLPSEYENVRAPSMSA